MTRPDPAGAAAVPAAGPHVPAGISALCPYLMARDPAALLAFMVRAFAAEPGECLRRKDGSVMHAEARIAGCTVMIGGAGDAASPAALHLYVPDCDAAWRRAIEVGATTLREPVTQFYGDRTAGIRDPEGNSWWLATHVESLSPAEIQRRALV